MTHKPTHALPENTGAADKPNTAAKLGTVAPSEANPPVTGAVPAVTGTVPSTTGAIPAVPAPDAGPGMPNMDDPKNIYLLKDAPVFTALLSLGIPMAAGLAITSIYNVINSYFVGHYGTVEELAATGYGVPVFGIIMAIAGGRRQQGTYSQRNLIRPVLCARLRRSGCHRRVFVCRPDYRADGRLRSIL